VSRILLTWEMGSNLGHLSRLLPLARELKARGHRVLVAARDVALAASVLGPAGIRSGEAARSATENQNAGYIYKVRIRTDQSRFVVNGEMRPVQSGMTVQADITTGRRRVIEFFLSPVVKYLDEGLTVR
jgi:multidrug efflux pump subunit AcrA (membrane-fusion protein)